MVGRKDLAREFLELLYSGDADGALALAVECPKMFNFTTEVPDGFRMLATAMPAIYAEPPTRDYTAQYLDGDTVITQVSVRGVTKHGDDYRNDYLVIIKLTDDKVVSMQVYTDSAYANARLASFRR